jgi:hypothetical protein
MHKAIPIDRVITSNDNVSIKANTYSLSNRGTSSVKVNGSYTLNPGESKAYPSISLLTEYDTQLNLEFNNEGTNKLVLQTVRIQPNKAVLHASTGGMAWTDALNDNC